MSTRISAIQGAAAVLALLSVSVLTGCTERLYSTGTTPPGAMPLGAADPLILPGTGEETGGDAAGAASPAATDPGPRSRRLMVHSARFELSTPSVEEAVGRLAARVEQLGGYIESRKNAQVVCRVPAEYFSDLVTSMPSFGAIVNQTLGSQDVTRAYRDLGLRLETAEWSRRRVLALLERAEKIEDVLKLEEELRRLTEQIERLKGELALLSEQVTYSRVEVLFRDTAGMPNMAGPRVHSPFAWVNHVGVEHVMEAFGSVEMSAGENWLAPALLLPGAVSIDVPGGFVLVERDRDQIKAVSPDESKLWLREFSATSRADLAFWSEALKSHLIHRRGYELVAERPVRDKADRDGLELLFQVVSRDTVQRYLVTLYVLDGPFWSNNGKVRVVEFVAPGEAFDRHLQLVRRSTAPGSVVR